MFKLTKFVYLSNYINCVLPVFTVTYTPSTILCILGVFKQIYYTLLSFLVPVISFAISVLTGSTEPVGGHCVKVVFVLFNF